MGTLTLMRGVRASVSLVLLALLVVPSGTAPTSESAPSCVRGCRCAVLPEYPGTFAVNCSSPAAASALGSGPLGSRVRELRLTRHDDHLSVKEGAFHSFFALRSLHLDHLDLVKVYPGAFRGLDTLEELDLSHNALSAGDEVSRALRDLPQLRRLYLRGNNFGSANGVAPTLVSRTLKYVDLGRCKLRDLPPSVLGGLSHVRHVVIDGNFIRQFRAASFPRSVVSLDLSHNDIDRISLKELNELENVDAIELADNPLHCSCDLWQVSSDYNINKEIICASPKQLMGKNLLNLKKHQLCAGHKKVKREAGNELDDETLSGEENTDDLAEDGTVEEKTEASMKTEQDTSGNPEQHTENAHEPLDKKSPEDTESPDNDSRKPGNEDTDAEEVEQTEGDEVGPENIYGEESVDPIVREGDQEKTQLEGDRLTSGDKPEPIDEDEPAEELVFVPEKKDVPVDDYEYDQSKVNVEDTPSNEKTGDEIEPESNDDDTDASGVAEENSSDKKVDDNHGTATNKDGDIVNEDEETAGNVPLTENAEGENVDTPAVGESVNLGSADEKVEEGETDETDNNDFEDVIIEENPPDSLPPSEYMPIRVAQEQENKNEARSGEIDGKDELDAEELPNSSHENVGETQIQNEKNEAKSGIEDSDSEDVNSLTAVGTADSETRPDPNEEIHLSSNEKLEPSGENTESQEGKGEISETERNTMPELPDGQIVETVEDNENVVHTNDVGARMEDESENEPNTREDEVDAVASDNDTAEKENGNVEEKSLDEIEEKIEAEEADLLEKEKDFVSKENVEGEESPDDEISNETLEKELEEDRLHSTLGHGDLSEGNEDERVPPFEDSETPINTENEDPVENIAEEKTAEENLPVSNDDDEEEEPLNENDDIVHKAEADEDEDEYIPRVASETDGATGENDYENIKGGKETDAPGDSISIAADTEESDEEEGSGTGVEVPVNEIVHTDDNSDDWSDVNETVNEAVPPLDNAESNERHDEGALSEEKSEPSEAPPEDVIAGVEDENEEEGSGTGSLDRIPLDGGDEEPASNENEDGSGMLLPAVHVPEEEESSSNEPFIPIVPGFHDSSDGETTSVDHKDDVDKDITEKESSIPTDIEKDSIPRRKIPVQSAPARPHGIHEENAKEREDPVKDSHELLPSVTGEDDLVDPVSAPEDVDNDVEGAEENLGTNENVLAAVPELESSADGSEALNKDGAFNFNTIASYIVLGAIMLLVVILLAYAVCRSRRQKSATTKEKDVENPGREMLDVSKPLINHHPSAPEKQPLDETQQPLMTKEQEASLSLEPSEKIPLTQDETDHNPKQNGEVIVEQRPIANGKAASPAAIRAPSPAVLSPAPTAPPVASAPATSPVAPPALATPASPAASPPRSPTHSPVADGHMNGNALPLANGGTHTPPRAASPALPASSPASGQPPVSPGAVRVVAKELPDSVAKRPVIIMNRGADPAQPV